MDNIKNIKKIIKDKIKDKLEPEDIEFIRDFGIIFVSSGAFIISSILIMTFMFFYGSPWIIVWSVLLILLKIRFCESGLEVSLEDFLRKHFKISITFIR